MFQSSGTCQIPLPVVWSDVGPVLNDVVLPVLRIQLKSSDVNCV